MNVSGADIKVGGKGVKKSVDASEDEVGGTVAVVPILPALNNTCVVTMDDEASVRFNHSSDGAHEEFKSDCLSPSDILLAISGAPTQEESPGMPMVTNSDA